VRARLQKLLDVIANSNDGQVGLRRAALARSATIAGGALPAIETLPDKLVAFVERVARAAWQVTDEQVEALRASGVDEDTIFEVTIAASLGAGLGRYQVALRAIEAAREMPAATGNG
jgi:hypothetical protein